MSFTKADYAIIGAGAAGLQLCLRMLEDPFFSGKQILLIDADTKTRNDRTWSFWEKGQGRWDEIVWKSWSTARFSAPGFSADLPLTPYRYKSVRGIDFYRYALTRIEASQQVERITEHAVHLTEVDHGVSIQLDTGTIRMASHVFDSRLPAEFQQTTGQYASVMQHFGGWVVRFEEEVFNPDVFTMMDFNRRYQDTCSFTYILPETSRQGLVEFTFFSPQLVDKQVYEQEVESYISHHFPGKAFTVLEKEFGVIPMSDFPFHLYHTKAITRIGTGGGWVKPSTGYSFRNAERYIDRMITNMKRGNHPASGLYSTRHRYYDALFVHRLQHENSIGHTLFSVMYRKNPIERIFRFLDEESTFSEDLRIMSTFNPWPFMRLIVVKLSNRVFKRRRL